MLMRWLAGGLAGLALVSAASVQAAIPAAERQALMDLYNSTNGSAWSNHAGWGGAAGTECVWYGVTCDAGETTVVRLELQDNDLWGTLPSSLAQLSNLEYLNLMANFLLSGDIPASLGTLSNLQVLWLWADALSGPIPPELGNLANLQYLWLAHNQLTGSIPPQLGNLASVQTLDLSENQLTGAIPSQLGNLTNLQILDLSQNQLGGSIPSQLGNLANLQELSIYSNQLTGQIPAELGNLGSLEGLHLTSNQLTGPIPPELGNLANLEQLGLSLNQLTGAIPPEIGNLGNLSQLGLARNRFSGPIPAELGNDVKLEVLDLSANRLTGEVPASITNLYILPGTQRLDVRWNGIYSSDPTVVAFLNAAAGNWQAYQTIAPGDVAAAPGTGNTQALVSWTPILYTGDSGGYRVSYALGFGGPYTFFGMTPDKTSTSLVVTGLEPATTYYFIVETQTDPSTHNDNTVVSDPSAEVSATTLPALVVSSGTLPQGTTGQPYSATLTASGGTPPYTWIVVAGALPDGLTLSGSGIVLGRPSAAGNFAFTVQAEDSVGSIGEATYSLEIVRGSQIPTLGGVGMIMFILALALAGLVALREQIA